MPSRTRHSAGAFTLAEVLLGVMVTSLVGLSVATVSGALSNAYNRGEATQQALHAARTSLLRTQRTLQGARLILGVYGNGVLVWREDTNDDGLINFSEITAVGWSASTGRVTEHCVVLPDWLPWEWRPLYDPSFSLSLCHRRADLIAATIFGHPWSESTHTGAEITALEFGFDVGPPEARTVLVTLTAGQGRDAVTLRTAATLRAAAVEDVDYVYGEWVLNP